MTDTQPLAVVPPAVTPGAPITSTWGNAVVQALSDLAGMSGPCTLPGGFTGTCNVYRRGELVVINMNITMSGTPAAGATIFTVPAGFLPLATWFVAAYITSGTVLYPLNISGSTGAAAAHIAAPSAGATVRGSAAWTVAGGN